MKGIARVRLCAGRIRLAELHWYEAHGIGKKEMERKKYLEQVMKKPEQASSEFVVSTFPPSKYLKPWKNPCFEFLDSKPQKEGKT